ncbi:hypothetical protein HJG60_017939 [Phyllostomus discolor]|uniref:Nuclear body protein SP140-like protein n=1 Tax=Phyllostomus discolor TaxID=89673 RepID=A0A834ED02_9CHIR|nr:hypothetical protein HJG60_017939 [Phyllostomus discolor]
MVLASSKWMSPENYKLICEIAFKLFKEWKVEISDAIKTPFPFLEILRDREFITKEMYEVSKETFKKGQNIEEVVYDVLTEVQRKFEPSLLKILFDEFTLKRNPDLKHIYEIFKNEIPDKKLFPENQAQESEERPDTQSRFEPGAVDSETSSTSEKTKRKRKSGKHKEDNVDMEAETLPVICGDIRGLLIKRKFEQGATRKCIRTADGNWLTPREFEVRGGYEKASNWKTSLTCGGKTLKRLMEEDKVPTPPTTCGRSKKGGSSDKCEICQDGAKLFRCEKCRRFFHENCHLPPVDTKRNGWRCTSCTIDDLPKSQQHYRESEVLERQMEPEEKLKCAFLLLKLYGPLENGIFLKIPENENYVEKASQCLERLRMLDKIKKSLNEGGYTTVKDFVQAMHTLFQDPKCNNSDLTEEEFKKNFKEVFTIQETN